MTQQADNNLAQLYRKLAEIAGEVGAVAKDSTNTQLNYKYASPSAVIAAVKPLLAARKLAIIPSVGEVIKEDTGTATKSGAVNVLTRLVMTFLILDGETGESLHIPWVGEGVDWSDKGIAKAQTIALRTFLLNAFQIPSEDEDTDPDRGGAHHNGAAPSFQRSGPAKGPGPRATQPQPQPQAGEGSGASEKQVKAIYAIGRASKRLSESQVDDECVNVFGVRPGELTKAEASQFIDMLKGDQGGQGGQKARQQPAVTVQEQPPDWLEYSPDR